MTERQEIAYRAPCARAEETGHERFTALTRPWFSILTVNK